MKTKEKAEELVNKYYDDALSKMLIIGNSFDFTKQCALIAVDEILKNSVGYNAYDGVTDNDICADDNYWEEVKSEIEKL